MKELRNLTFEEMETLAAEAGQKKFRGRQLYEWIYKGKTDFREMKNLPEVFIRGMEDEWRIDSLELLRIQKSKTDGTQKFLFGLGDGEAVESVFMKYKYGNSVCVSSQAGCRMNCSFCASGIRGLKRGLSPGEIVSQVLDVERETGETVNHIVMMGTGEPFDNYENVARFIRLMNDRRGRNLSMRRITVSTCGLIPGIRRFTEDFPQVNLAISLHAPSDELRSRLMPVNRSYHLDELIRACREYTEKTKRRVTFEYALIRGINDSDRHAEQLANLIKGMLCHVNLIPLNQVDETGYTTAGRGRALEFMRYLESCGVTATTRRQLGADIDGACGQLRLAAR